MATWMATLLHTLPAHQREIVRLRLVVGLSAQQTGNIVGASASVVRVIQHRTLQTTPLDADHDQDQATASPLPPSRQ